MNLYSIKLKKYGSYNDMYVESNIETYRKICIDEVKKKYRMSITGSGYCTISGNKAYDCVIDLDFDKHQISTYKMIRSMMTSALRDIAINKIL